MTDGDSVAADATDGDSVVAERPLDDDTADERAVDSDDTADERAVGDDAAARGRPRPKIAVTGTPGTGKTTATEGLGAEIDLPVIHLNDEIRAHGLWEEYDADRDSLVADPAAIAAHLGEWHGLLESHLAHRFDADRVVVLRCAPAVLESRLRERGESAESARENAESEALDVILTEAVDRHGPASVYEIDTTGRPVTAVADEIRAVIDGERSPSAGGVDFTGYLRG